MKRIILTLVCIFLCVTAIALSACAPKIKAGAEEIDWQNTEGYNESIKLVEDFIKTTNDKDVESYISLFTSDVQAEMNHIVESSGKSQFFQSEQIELKNLKALSDEIGKRSASVSDDEISAYEDYIICYAEMVYSLDGAASNDAVLDLLENGYTYRDFIIVKEGGEWKILRVSSPALSFILDANEGFGTLNESRKADGQ